MVTLDDVAVVVKARFDAASAFTTAVPGKAWFGRGPDAPDAYPYGVFVIEKDGDPQFQTDGSFLQKFLVRMATYTPPAASVTDAQSVQLAMTSVMQTNLTTWTALRDGKVLHALPRAFDGKFDDRLRRAGDVFVVGGAWQLLVSGSATP